MSLLHRVIYPCDQIVEFTYDYLEGALPPLTLLRFHLHLRTCKGCKEFVRLYRAAANPAAFLHENPIPTELKDYTLLFLEAELEREFEGGTGRVAAGEGPAV